LKLLVLHERWAGGGSRDDFYGQEVIVKLPRLRIGRVMIAVGIIALNFGVIRAVTDLESRFVFLLSVLVLPMANILAIGLLLAFLRPQRRDFLRGFELFGLIALICVVGLAMVVEGLVTLYLAPPMALFEATIGPPPPIRQNWPTYPFLVGFCFFSVWATWPQLAFAVIGGFLSRRSGAAMVRPDRARCA
jgi:hypothetical protein